MTTKASAYELRGEAGEVVLTLNGGMMTFASWAPVTAGLLPSYRLLGFDFQGQLRSPGEAHPNLEAHAADVVALLDELGLDRVHVLATSFGAEVAVLLAALQPPRLHSLALVTAAVRTPPGMAESARHLQGLVRDVLAGASAVPVHQTMLQEIYSDAYRRAQGEALEARGKQTAALPVAWYRGLLGILEAIQDFDLTPHLSAIRCPTMVVHAADDQVMPLATSRALASGIAGAQWRQHPTSGHALVVEDPLWLQHIYRQFLAQLPSVMTPVSGE